MCFVCLNRIAPGVIQHLGYGQVVLGEFQRPPELPHARTRRPVQGCGRPCKVTENLAQSHWEKLVWNIPFNGLGVAGAAGPEILKQLSAPITDEAGFPSSLVPQPSFLGSCLSTDVLLADERWARLVRELMLEIISAAHVLGFPIPERFADELIARTRKMGAYKASTLIDFERGQALELDGLFREPLRQATRTGAPVPRLSALCAVLTHAQRSLVA